LHPETTFINEAGVYKLVFKSTNKEAELFTDWIAEKVLPELRKTGSYSMTPSLPPTDTGTYIEQVQRVENITHARIQMLLYDRIANELSGNTNQKTLTDNNDWCMDVTFIVSKHLDKKIDCFEAARVGKHVVKNYRLKFNKEPKKSPSLCNGKMRDIFAYEKQDEPLVIKWIMEFYNK
jgi:hypothetical protein